MFSKYEYSGNASGSALLTRRGGRRWNASHSRTAPGEIHPRNVQQPPTAIMSLMDIQMRNRPAYGRKLRGETARRPWARRNWIVCSSRYHSSTLPSPSSRGRRSGYQANGRYFSHGRFDATWYENQSSIDQTILRVIISGIDKENEPFFVRSQGEGNRAPSTPFPSTLYDVEILDLGLDPQGQITLPFPALPSPSMQTLRWRTRI